MRFYYNTEKSWDCDLPTEFLNCSSNVRKNILNVLKIRNFGACESFKWKNDVKLQLKKKVFSNPTEWGYKEAGA